MTKKARKSGNKRTSGGRARKVARTSASRVKKAVKPAKPRATSRPTRVRVVRSRATRARKPAARGRKPMRPLPPAEMLSERLFLSSLERSLRDNRMVWETLAKK